MCKTSDGVNLFLKEKGGNNQTGMWLDNHAKYFRYDISNRKSYDDISNGWGCQDERKVIKEESVNTEWVTITKLLKCIQSKINGENKDNNLAVRGVWMKRNEQGTCTVQPGTWCPIQ